MTGNNVTESQFKASMNQLLDSVVDKDYVSDELNSIDLFTVNRGNKTPFKFTKRNNVTIEPSLDQTSQGWIFNKILSAEVQNARQGKYYRIATIYRPQDLGNECRWIIEECDEVGFENSDTAVRVITAKDKQPMWSNNTGIQTIILSSPRDTHRDMVFKVTIDTGGVGGIFRATVPTDTAYALIIDPAFYQFKLGVSADDLDDKLIEVVAETDTKLDSINSGLLKKVDKLDTLNLNSGRDTPLLSIDRNGMKSPPHIPLNSFLLDAKVRNADPKYFYRIAIFMNGSTALSNSHLEGWRIEKIPKSAWGAEDENSIFSITNGNTPSEVLDRDQRGIQKISLKATQGIEIFELTIDVDKLPRYGTIVRSYLNSDAGYSFIVHPIFYEPEPQKPPVPPEPETLNVEGFDYEYNSKSKRLTLTWLSGQLVLRQVFGLNGFNSLPNFVSLRCKDSKADDWVIVQSYASDVLPPLILESTQNSTASDLKSIYTGGNHGTSGSSGGFKTAINDNYQIILGGNAIDMSVSSSGVANTLKINISNRLHAYNTIQTDDSQGRYVLQQNFMIDFKDGSWCVTCFNKKLEDVTIKSDNGLQTFSNGINESWLFLDGQFKNRVVLDPTQGAGAYSKFPDAWATIYHGSDTQWVTWYDKTIGLGDGSQISGNATRFRGGGETNSKVYSAIIAAKHLTMTDIDSYSWRMGFSIQSKDLPKPVGSDSAFIWNRVGKTSNVIVFNANEYFLE